MFQPDQLYKVNTVCSGKPDQYKSDCYRPVVPLFRSYTDLNSYFSTREPNNAVSLLIMKVFILGKFQKYLEKLFRWQYTIFNAEN